METRFSIEQLESMTTHEVADLLSNIVLVLRRRPNVEVSQLGQEDQSQEHYAACRCGECEKCQRTWQRFIGADVTQGQPEQKPIVETSQIASE